MVLIALVTHRLAHAQTATLFVSTNVSQAEVSIDDQVVGITDNQGHYRHLNNLAEGRHTIMLRKVGYRPATKQFEYGGFTEEVRFMLKEAPALLIVRTNLATADVLVDGAFVGTTQANGVLYVNTEPGRHDILITREGFASKRASVIAKAGLTEEVRLRLAPLQLWERLVRDALRPALAVTGLLAVLLLLGARTQISEWWSSGFDRYTLKEEIGRGGMATVYRARDRANRRVVALKIMNESLVRDTDLVQKFLSEGEALERITQTDPDAPIVNVYRYGRAGNREDGRPFLALELIEGEDLLHYLKRRDVLSPDRALAVIAQVASGLSVAHQNQIWHRDVTPDNVILVGPSDLVTVRLIDFGVAKHEYTSTRTLDGSITGKPPYMSPEQCRAEPLDARTDIYSLGVLFYALLTGRPPFCDSNPLMVMRMHELEPLPGLPAHIPKKVRDLVYEMLEKERAARPESMEEVRQRCLALAKSLKQEEIPV